MTVLICGECGEGNWRPTTGDGMHKCDYCGRWLHITDFQDALDAGESLTLTTDGLLAVVHGGEQ